MAKKGIQSNNNLSLDELTVTPSVSTSGKKTKKPVSSPVEKPASSTTNSCKLPKGLLDNLNSNITRYNGNSEKGKPVYMPVALVEKLQELSNRHYKRVSARAIATAILDTVLSHCGPEEIMDNYMQFIQYTPPTAEELAARAAAAERAKAARAAAKKG